MERHQVPMFRYGEPDFDREYLKWGMHDPATQKQEAESVLKLFPPGRKMAVLDLACGAGVHALHFAQAGHQVTGVDISEVFIAEARKAAVQAGKPADFQVGDIRRLSFKARFDAVTWIETSFFDSRIASGILAWLVEGGVFIMDVRNPEHPRSHARNADRRTWREEAGRFLLERHEMDEQGMRLDQWIEIDTINHKIIERESRSPADSSKSVGRVEVLKDSGFKTVELRTLSGDLFQGGPDEYWLWIVARK